MADAFADVAREEMARVVISIRRESILRAGSLRRSVTLQPSHGRISVKHAENHTRHVAHILEVVEAMQQSGKFP